jgi:hypothetical protein
VFGRKEVEEEGHFHFEEEHHLMELEVHFQNLLVDQKRNCLANQGLS